MLNTSFNTLVTYNFSCSIFFEYPNHIFKKCVKIETQDYKTTKKLCFIMMMHMFPISH